MIKKHQQNKLIKSELAKEDISILYLLEYYQSCKQPITNARGSFAHIQPVIERLFKKDYNCVIIGNEDGSLCNSYPYRICIPVGFNNCDKCDVKSDKIPTADSIKSYFASSSLGRGRGRFVAPISLLHYHDSITNTHYARFSLRSASLIQKPEVLLNKVTRRSLKTSLSADVIPQAFEKTSKKTKVAQKLHISSKKIKPPTTLHEKEEEKPTNSDEDTTELSYIPDIEFEAQEVLCDDSVPVNSSKSPTRMEKIRKEDIRSLKGFGVSYIGDLMVEEKLKLLRVLQVISSEKADKKQRYNQFHIYSIPYPGYEYFGACNLNSVKLKENKPNKHRHDFLVQVSKIK